MFHLLVHTTQVKWYYQFDCSRKTNRADSACLPAFNALSSLVFDAIVLALALKLLSATSSPVNPRQRPVSDVAAICEASIVHYESHCETCAKGMATNSYNVFFSISWAFWIIIYNYSSKPQRWSKTRAGNTSGSLTAQFKGCLPV